MTDAGLSVPLGGKTITEHELEQCQRANETGRQPVVFVHRLWLLPGSWDRWAKLFEDYGYVALTLAGRMTPRRSRRPPSTRRCSPASRSARSPTTSRPSSAG
jgi:hypothetical protein